MLHDPKQHRDRGGHFTLLFTAHHPRKSGQEPGGRSVAYRLVQPASFYNPGLPGQEWWHPQLSVLSYINHQLRKFPTELLIGKLIKALFFFQLRVPFPNDSSVCQVNKKLSGTIPCQHYTNMTLLNNNILFFVHLKDLYITI